MPEVAQSRVSLIAFIFIYVIAMLADGRSGKVCNSVHVRNNVSYFNRLKGCTVVEGYVMLVLLDKTHEKDFVNISFPELREITQYLVVYRLRGLRSIGQLFPNLVLIRGTSLLSNAALTIVDNHILEDIGLKSLTHIMAGDVIIFKNYHLCFANTIDWSTIMMKSTSKSYYEVTIENVKDENQCKSKKICKNSGCEKNRCWKEGQCQVLQLKNCHPLCAGGCHLPDADDQCYACKGVLSEGRCLSSCPPGQYVYLKRTCITKEQCIKTVYNGTRDNPVTGAYYFTFNNSCISDCPSRFRKDPTNSTCIPCEGNSCFKECAPPILPYPDRFRISMISDSKELQSCTKIRGSLIIDGIQGTYFQGIEKTLEENLGMIEEITGRLEIIHSHALLSLNFLSNLRQVKGIPYDPTSNSNANQYSLIVKDNKNLQQLWDWEARADKPKLQISKGKVFFHFNPKLCLTEIDRLRSMAELPLNLTNLEVSKESNGFQTICDPTSLNVTVESLAAHSFILALHLAPNTSTENIGRFMVFYMEAKEIKSNDSIYDTSSDCSGNQWNVNHYDGRSYSNGTIYMLITRLEPAVEYLYFVRSYSLSSSIGTTEVQTVKTLPDQPSVVRDFQPVNTTASTITVSWKPPFHPHGDISHYIIQGYHHVDITDDLRKRDYCLYRMQKNEVISSKTAVPVATTPAPRIVNDCEKQCSANVTEKPVQSPWEYCNSFEHASGVEVTTVTDELITCDSFIHSVINTNFQRLATSEEQNSKNEFDAAIPNVFPDMDDVSEDIVESNRTNADGKLETFRIEVGPKTTQLTINNLIHFSEYIVLISACQDRHPRVREPCSRYSFLSIRTDRSWEADRITEGEVHIEVTNQTANVSWKEPLLVNSFVHSYILEYRSVDVENSKFLENCVTTMQFNKSNGSYLIENLPSGHYELRLKVVSLAGEGMPTNTTFYIEEHGKTHMSIIVSSAVIAMIFICILIAFLYYWKWQINKNRILFASVNPRYEPVYVEDHWEVPREHLTLVKQLGRGTFGSVHEGILQPDNIRCAVKTVTAVSDEDNVIFLKEATLMKEFHKAFHIVKLIGVVSKGTPVYVIMELMEMGDLKSFLLKHGAELSEDRKTLPAEMIFKMAAEIADGMAFLEAKKFVHRDLAARNCMVSGDRVIKIGDFGLARDIYETDYYRKGDKGTLPIRWMAPESIRDGIFTSNSDVWSYGVVLWEISTLAQMPYHPRTNEEVIRYVQSGQILDIPSHAHAVLKPLMKCCWRWHASQRPKFAQILKLLDSYVDHKFRKVSFFHNGEDPNDPTNVVPSQTTAEECYIYNDENNEISLYLSQSPSASTSASTPSGTELTTVTGTKEPRYVPYRANGHVENLR